MGRAKWMLTSYETLPRSHRWWAIKTRQPAPARMEEGQQAGSWPLTGGNDRPASRMSKMKWVDGGCSGRHQIWQKALTAFLTNTTHLSWAQIIRLHLPFLKQQLWTQATPKEPDSPQLLSSWPLPLKKEQRGCPPSTAVPQINVAPFRHFTGSRKNDELTSTLYPQTTSSLEQSHNCFGYIQTFHKIILKDTIGSWL